MSKRRPNVLVIMTDQHRAEFMTCAGNDLVPTPNMDRIASRGVRFTNAVCPYPVCVASRMSLLTGLYAHSTGAIDNRDRLDWRYRTMAHHFGDAGYLTGLIGKMHFNDAHKHGFEYYMSVNDWLMYLGPKQQLFADEIANHPIGPHFFDTVIDDGSGFPDIADVWDGSSPWAGNVARWEFEDIETVASKLEAEDHLDSFVARESRKFLERYRDQPFFLITSFMKPHPPFYPPRRWADMYPLDSIELPDPGDSSQYPDHIRRRIERFQQLGAARLKAHRAGYLGSLAYVDTCVGAVYEALEDLGLVEETIVVYTSDHGDMDGDHGLYQKFCLFDPSVRVPLIVSSPGRYSEGETTHALTEYFGLYPTLSDLAGLAPPSRTTVVPIDGAPTRIDADSFAEVVLDPTKPGPEAVYCEYALRSETPQYMVRTDHYKYNYNHGSGNELYDLRQDPGECVNSIDAPAMATIRKEMHDRLVSWYDPESNPYRNTGGRV